MTLECSECGMPTNVAFDQALELECKGIHFLQEGTELVPIMTHGLRVGFQSKVRECETGIDVRIGNNCDLFRCKVGDHTKIKHYVEVQPGVEIGKFCKIESFVFIPEGVRIGNGVFLGPHCVFTNDRYPTAVGDWKLELTVVEDKASIGAGAVILPGMKIGKNSLVGAGSLVTKNVAADSIYYGNPARFVRPI